MVAVSIAPGTTITAGNSTTFEITYNPTVVGTSNATINIANNDSDENPYTFDITGEAITCTPTTTVSSITPASGPVGTLVTINGSGFTSATAVSFGIYNAVFTIVSNTVIQATVPANATSGNIVIQDAGGCDLSYSSFTVIIQDNSTCDPTAIGIGDLFISEVTDASTGSLSYIQIFNATGADVDMTDYEVLIRNNGNPTGDDIALTGILVNGGTFVLATSVGGSSCAVPGGDGTYADQNDVSSGVNNNDCIHLARLGTIIDTWGICDGSTWIGALGLGSAGYDFKRNPSATPLPSTTFNVADWTIVDFNSCSDNYDLINSYEGIRIPPSVTTLGATYGANCTTATISVNGTEAVLGGAPLTYQWFFSAPGDIGWTMLANGGVYSGATTDILSISNIAGLEGYQYYCQIMEDTPTCFIASEAVSISGGASTTWNGTSWSRGIPTIFQHVILTANYNTEIHGNIDACQMTVNSGVTLDILDGTDGTYVYVVNSIFNNGTINVTSKANLVQVNHPLDLNDEAIVTPNINFSKNTGDKIRWDYVYWGKPIADNVLSAYNANFDIKYYWDPDFAGIGQSYLGWRVLNSEPSIGMGFITRVKTAIGMTPTDINLSYSGVSNNGDYNATVKYYDADNYSFRNFTLLGNPYPGAIDFEKFYLDNSDKIYGTVYLWSSYTPYPGSGLYQQADYASFNLTGGVGVPGTSNTQSPNGILPNGYIASAQGFMVRPKVNGQVVFNNSQRTKDIPSNNQFFRTQNQQKDRFWLRLTDSNGRFSDLLIGYIDKATNGFDEAYDGLLNSLSTLKFFSQLDEKRLVIQGRGNFDIEDKVMIDYAISNQESTMLTISLSKKEGIFNDQKIYLHDKKLNFYHDLTIADYFFHTDDTQNRFEVLYEIIKPEEILDNNDINVFATINNNELIVKSNSVLSNVELYDINGRLVFKEDFNQDLMQFNKNVFLPNGIYIAIVKTKSGFQKSIKISN